MPENIRILIVDDNKSIHDDFKKILCGRFESSAELDDLEKEIFGDEGETVSEPAAASIQYEVDSAYQGQDALRMVIEAEKQGRPYALAFVDVRMPPGWDGIETISRIWKKNPFIEMVICTAYSDYSWEEITGKLGATDKLLFLTKPYDAIVVKQMSLTLINKWNLGKKARDYVETLEKEVGERTQQLQQVLKELESKNSELALANKQLEQVALHDSLTHLPNRVLFNDRLQHTLKVAKREKTCLAVAIIDLDNFKEVNDVHGHLAGDQVLHEVGERLSMVLRTSDTVARIGGDEFAVILPGADSDSVKKIGANLIKVFEEAIILGDAKINLNGSLGFALYPDHGQVEEALMSAADSAMYRVKHKDGGTFELFEADNQAKQKNKIGQ